MELKNLTAQEREALRAEFRAAELEERSKREAEIETYKKMVCETVSESFPQLKTLSAAIASTKELIRESFSTIIDMKAELYGTKEGQQSHQFMDDQGTLRIKIGFNMIDNYDDTAEAGIEKVRDYISSLASDEKSQILVDTIMKLLSKDSKGTLKASRVLQLQQMADKSGDESFSEGVHIILNAYKPLESKSYIRAEWKDDKGVWQNVPLGITEA